MIDESSMCLLREYSPDVNPRGWLVSRKFNGVRLWWDGVALWTREGNRITAPAWFTRGLPAMPLDGELVGDAVEDRFEVARQAAQLARWTPRCRFVVFGPRQPERGPRAYRKRSEPSAMLPLLP